jgi:hypothetical protein
MPAAAAGKSMGVAFPILPHTARRPSGRAAAHRAAYLSCVRMTAALDESYVTHTVQALDVDKMWSSPIIATD